MAFSSWRGIVGIIKPTMRPGGLEDMIRLLPEGIGVIPLFNDIQRGERSEFKEVMKDYDAKVAVLAEQGCDVIHPEGAPPFMVMGLDGEAKKIKSWERKHKIPVFTSGTNHIAALRALKVKRIVGAKGKADDRRAIIVATIDELTAHFFTEGKERKSLKKAKKMNSLVEEQQQLHSSVISGVYGDTDFARVRASTKVEASPERTAAI